MNKLFVTATLLLSSSAVWAIPFEGAYDVSVNTSGPGLQVTASPDSGLLGFDIDVGESTGWLDLFRIRTIESTVNADDLVPVSASIAFDFWSPTSFGGTAEGTTQGLSFLGVVQAGYLRWSSSVSSLYFGNGGILDLRLEDAFFGEGWFGLSEDAATVRGKFTLRRGADAVAVPEPATLSLFGGALLLLAFVRRRRTAQRPHQS